MVPITDKSKRVFVKEGKLLEICPFSYNECRLPAGQECQLKLKLQKIRDKQVWMQSAEKASFCKHLGMYLTRRQYENKHLGRII